MPSTPAPAAAPDSLPELLRIMDVATALRHEREKAAAHLDLDQVKAALRQRLRATADTMGETVSDAEIEAAIARYFAQLHEYRDPPRSWRSALAHLYVRRGTLALVLLAGALLAGTVWWLFVAESGPWSAKGQEARLAQQRLEQHNREQRDLDARWQEFVKLHTAALALAQDGTSKQEIATLEQSAKTARAANLPPGLAHAHGELEQLRAELEQEYEVRIVSRPGERSGVDAYVADQRQTLSGYYLIVEAVTPKGTVLERRIRDAESGKTVSVRKWGELVPQAVYDRIAADKRADGIVDEGLFARKRRGYRHEEIVLPLAPGGQPIPRVRQITSKL